MSFYKEVTHVTEDSEETDVKRTYPLGPGILCFNIKTGTFFASKKKLFLVVGRVNPCYLAF